MSVYFLQNYEGLFELDEMLVEQESLIELSNATIPFVILSDFFSGQGHCVLDAEAVIWLPLQGPATL